MQPNPYHSPTTIQPKAALESREKPDRPVGVSILAVLHIIGGGLLLIAQFVMIANLNAMQEPLESIGIPPALLIVGVMFLCVVTLASGVGMWLGTRWGWWLMAFYYVYGILRNAMAIVTVGMLADQLEGAARGPEYYVVKHGMRVVIQAMILCYCFKANVVEYFDLRDVSKLKALAILSGICIAIAVLTAALGYTYG